jgi:DNA-3-methyladenine glycosylase I
MNTPKTRCHWVSDNPLYIDYHDNEWGRPVHDDTTLFEFLTLEGAQAGLSWITILKRRDAYREAFCDFDVEKIAGFNKRRIESLLNNPAIIRNRLKIESTVSNAQAFIKIQDAQDSFNDYLWAFVDNAPIINHWEEHTMVPATTDLSNALAKDLKRRGFRFVGSTICYAYMQAIGMVNDHSDNCFLKVAP